VSSSVRERLTDAGLQLPAYVPPASNYLPLRRHGDLVYCAGVTSDGFTGPVGAHSELGDARAAAAFCACRQLSAIEACLGSLDAVATVLRVTGYVVCEDGFSQTPQVIDGASDVFLVAYGDAGRHARSAVGVRALPGDATVELEAIVALHPGWELGVTS
jgi:enamine deaminase RidA (YjgF/YER057c/UK114 family)